jgi:hypothetical protein
MEQCPLFLPTNRKQQKFHTLTHICLSTFTIHVHQAQISPPDCKCGGALLYDTPSYPSFIQAKKLPSSNLPSVSSHAFLGACFVMTKFLSGSHILGNFTSPLVLSFHGQFFIFLHCHHHPPLAINMIPPPKRGHCLQ